jgi:excinuclease ABC subunit A
VLDEPITGLHTSDISHLLEIINRLVEAGNTVIVIEHNTSVIKNADWIIDYGPGWRHEGRQGHVRSPAQATAHCKEFADQ